MTDEELRTVKVIRIVSETDDAATGALANDVLGEDQISTGSA